MGEKRRIRFNVYLIELIIPVRFAAKQGKPRIFLEK